MLAAQKKSKAGRGFEIILIAVITFFPVLANAQDSSSKENQLEVTGQFRPRFELRNGTFRPLERKEKPAALITQRVRVTVDYSHKDILSVRIAPQAVSIWGNSPMTQTSKNLGSSFSLYEAWASIKLASRLNLKIGRQPISLDDERFFGELDWAQGARVHDAVSFQYKTDKAELRSFTAFNQNYTALYNDNLNNPSGNLFTTTNGVPYKWMQTFWTGVTAGNTGKFSVLLSYLGLQDAVAPAYNSHTNHLLTGGANYFYNGSGHSGTASVYYQTGKDGDGRKVSAFLVAVNAGMKLDPHWQIRAGSDFLSGNTVDGNAVGETTSRNRYFNPVFNTGHKFYGYMDYFYAGNSHQETGLSDNYVVLRFNRNERFDMSLALHQFLSPARIQTEEKRYSHDLGQELDLVVAKGINKYSKLEGGLSLYRTTPSINFIKNRGDARLIQHWIWLSLNVTPRFFKTKF